MAAATMSQDEKDFISQAKRYLESPGFVMRAADIVGRPVEALFERLPDRAQNGVRRATDLALRKGLALVLRSLNETPNARLADATFTESHQKTRVSGWLHTSAAFGAGVVGGFVGLASLPIELPLTTALMLRSIAVTAREFGMDLSDPTVRLECLYVLSLGSSRSNINDARDTAYWTSRVAVARLLREAGTYFGARTAAEISRELEKGAAPVLVRFLSQIASRFEVVVSQKVLSELIPVVGAVGGGLVNAAFSDHFNQAARFHFGLRRLEKVYGEDVVREFYENAPRIS